MIRGRSVLSAAALLAGLLLVGCTKPSAETEVSAAPPPAAAAGLPAGANQMCPIMNKPASAAHPVEYNGKTYYVCCSMCESKFKADPTKWVAAIEKAEGAGG